MPTYIVGITGASGSILGVRALEELRAIPDTKVHLIMTQKAKRTLELETRIFSANQTTGKCLNSDSTTPQNT